MKNQYFGDAHDYFKYQVLDALATQLRGLECLSCIWMITGPEENNYGSTGYAPHPDLGELNLFFDQYRDFKRVWRSRYYFAERPYDFYPHFDRDDTALEVNRSEYFSSIPHEALERAVVFLDPDTGMEPSVASDAHLRYSELDEILRRMDHRSIAVVYQHRYRNVDWREETMKRLASFTGYEVTGVSDADVAFFVLALTTGRIHEINRALDSVVRRGEPEGPRSRSLIHPAQAQADSPRNQGGADADSGLTSAGRDRLLTEDFPGRIGQFSNRRRREWWARSRTSRSNSRFEGRSSSVASDHQQGEGVSLARGSSAGLDEASLLRSSTELGYVNRNQQVNLGSRGLPGTDHNQVSYCLRCGKCGAEYGANGTDIFQRRCPRCQGGRPGIPF